MTTLTRRSLTLGISALAASAAASAPAAARSPGQRAALPSVAYRKVGAVEVAAISDGFIEAPFSVFTGAPASEIEAAIAARFARRRNGRHRISFTVWLVDDGERLVLIDTGYAGLGGPTTGRLTAALAAIGVRSADVDAVAVTHMHSDHIGGLVADGRPAFPNAEVFIHRADVAHFTDAVRAAAAPAHLKSSFEAATRVVAATPRLQRFDGERALTRAISTVDLRGHTPGHTGYRIADGVEIALRIAKLGVERSTGGCCADCGPALTAPHETARVTEGVMAEAKRARAIGVNHVALEVGDIEEALAFYGRLFEFKLRGKSSDAAFIDLGDQFLALQKGRRQPGDDGRHFGLVVDDKEAVRRSLSAAGVKVLPGRFLDFLDPWGNRIEIVGYDNIQFTKAPHVLNGMGLAHLSKSEHAIKELTEKGMAPA